MTQFSLQIDEFALWCAFGKRSTRKSWKNWPWFIIRQKFNITLILEKNRYSRSERFFSVERKFSEVVTWYAMVLGDRGSLPLHIWNIRCQIYSLSRFIDNIRSWDRLITLRSIFFAICITKKSVRGVKTFYYFS